MMKVRPAFEDADVPAKPQLHTRKHHHAYNGARSLPLFTWVRPLSTGNILFSSTSTSSIDNSEETTTTGQEESHGQHDEEDSIDDHGSTTPSSSSALSTPTESTESTEEALYEVVLYYPQNRACTIYRSWDDFVLLRRGLCSTTRYKSLPDLDDEGGAGAGAGICVEIHPHDSACLHRFLKYVMERCSTSQAEPAVEFFLRRRMDDCDGGGGGAGFDSGDIW